MIGFYVVEQTVVSRRGFRIGLVFLPEITDKIMPGRECFRASVSSTSVSQSISSDDGDRCSFRVYRQILSSNSGGFLWFASPTHLAQASRRPMWIYKLGDGHLYPIAEVLHK
mmetsp:Transcript_110025/g.296070  ORF Transcript_110025/g.296070 Transcript_110025/m.296070 type:complete len:112 (-) Transcript_110025:13-348(-)